MQPGVKNTSPTSPVKKELGLGEPKAQGSTEQADKFKAAYQASAGPINAALQYTAAYAEKSKHDPLSAKRDTSCQAYQVALARIDPTNPSVAQGAIDQVLAAVKDLQSSAEKLKAAAEKAYTAWTAREGDFHSITDKIREMVDWGHEKAAPLQAVVEAINGKANERTYEEALKALEQLISKADPIYADYQKQKAAQEEYEPAYEALLPRLDALGACTYKSLQQMIQDIASAKGQVEQAASTKDYVSALTQLRALETKVTEFETKLAELEAKKAEYEAARSALDPKLAEASKCQYKSLADLDQPIVDLTTQTDTAAGEEKYDEAVTLVGQLTTKVDEKLTKVRELEAKKQEYETARGTLDPKLSEASTCQYKSLADLDQPIVDLTTQTDTAATDEKYDEAVTLVGQLTTKVDEKLAKIAEYEAAKTKYESALAALQPKLAEANQCKYTTLATMQQDLTTQLGEMEKKAAEEDYVAAASMAATLASNVDAFLQAIKDFEAKYQQQVKDAEAQVAKMNAHAQKAHYAAEIKAAADQVAAAKAKGDSGAIEEAMTALKAASASCFKVITAMDMLDKGLDKARADEVADVSKSLVDSGVDQEKALEVGQIMNKGGSGDIEDSKLVAKEVAELPIDVIKELRAKGTKVVACRDNITDYATDLKGKRPRNWPANKTWDVPGVPGVHRSKTNEVVIATRGHGTPGGPEVPKSGNGHGSFDLVTHETMHAYDHTGSPEHHDDDDFKKAWESDKTTNPTMDPYYTADSGAGQSEAYAESAARYYSGDPTLKTQWPEMHKYWEEAEKKKKKKP